MLRRSKLSEVSLVGLAACCFFDGREGSRRRWWLLVVEANGGGSGVSWSSSEHLRGAGTK